MKIKTIEISSMGGFSLGVLVNFLEKLKNEVSSEMRINNHVILHMRQIFLFNRTYFIFLKQFQI